MNLKFSFLGLASLVTSSCMAASIPYPNVGTLAPTHTFTAESTGVVTATFISGMGGDNDHMRLVDTTSGLAGAWLVPSHMTAAGMEFNLGQVAAGDVLSFQVMNDNPFDAPQIFSSDPNVSTDGTNHFYAIPISPGVVYLGMQDIPAAFSGLDYNAFDVTVSNVLLEQAITTPEPGTLALMGTGVLGVASVFRRRFASGAGSDGRS